MATVGTVDHAANGFDPHEVLTDWDTGVRSTDAQGRAVRTFEVTAEDKEIEIAPGIRFPAWTYNGRVPGPTLRVTEGDLVRIVFRNAGSKIGRGSGRERVCEYGSIPVVAISLKKKTI